MCPRDISTTALTEASNETVFYTEIYNITYSGTAQYFTPTMPLAASGFVFSLGDRAYYSFAIARSEVKTSIDTQVDNLSVSFENIDRTGVALFEGQDLRGAEVTISGVFLSSGTNNPLSSDPADMVHVFTGKIGGVKIDEKNVNVTINSPIKDIRVNVPRRFYSPGDGFNFMPPIG